MNARFYAPDASATGTLVSLPHDEARHLARVLRLHAGDAISVFNGRGGEFEAIVERVARDTVQVRTGPRREPAPEPRVAITLCQAVLKGDKMDDVVRDAVMLGVTSIQPVIAARTEVSLAALARGSRRERWERIAVSSAKQCGRAVVPDVRPPLAFDGIPDAIALKRLPAPVLLLTEPGTGVDPVPLDELAAAIPSAATLVIGPEGGWTPRELDRAAASCRFVMLGRRVLRADAAPLVALAALFAVWKEF